MYSFVLRICKAHSERTTRPKNKVKLSLKSSLRPLFGRVLSYIVNDGRPVLPRVLVLRVFDDFGTCTTRVLCDIRTMASKFAIGGRVSCAAKQFGIQWARDNFGKTWKTARVHGVVREVLGKRSYKVLYDGDPDPLESNEKTLKKSRARLPDDTHINDGGNAEPDVPTNGGGRCPAPSPCFMITVGLSY